MLFMFVIKLEKRGLKHRNTFLIKLKKNIMAIYLDFMPL